MIGSTLSHYQVIDEIGRGGMGVVYLAEDTRLGRRVALKFLADHLRPDSEARERFMVEARAAARLTHANIATIYEVVDDGETLFIAMEHVQGRDLRDVIREKDLSTDQAVDIALQVARGLERAHDEGVIHRDIKPENILVTERGEVKILDFGLAKLADTVGVTRPGTIAGTATCMSPEQITGGAVDRRTDLWSLGTVLYEMLTFERPFKGDYREAVYYSILNVAHSPISERRPEIGTAFDPIMERLLSKDPERRYPTARAFIDDVAPLIESGAPGRRGRPPDPVAPPSASAEPHPSSASEAPRSPSMVEERRQLTVVYGEIAGFGDLLEGLDPEDLVDLTDEYRSIWDAHITRFDALPGPSTGGTFCAYFGYPQASESDARSALRFGLSFRNAIQQHPQRSAAGRRPTPPVRVGVHTGVAVVGTDEDGYKVQGNISHVAALLSESAAEGSLVTSKVTRRLSAGYFDFESLGEKHVRGFAEPVEAFAVLRESGARTRLDFIEDADLSPLVGRDAEMATLRQRWKQARSGEGSIVLISGEAGLGKSRLVETFATELNEADTGRHVHLYCSSFETNSALHPLTDYLRENVRSGEHPSEPISFERLSNFLSRAGMQDDLDAALIAGLLDIPLPKSLEPPALAAAERQRRTMIALVRLLTARCTEAPGLLVIEDLHWADPSTLEWLEMLVSQVPVQALLILVTTRPHFRPAWLGKPRTSEVDLGKLEVADLIAISEHKSRKKLPPEILSQIVQKTDGVPLFTEELTNMILELGILEDRGDRYELTGSIPDHAIPSTLQGSLLARLDRLPAAKATAQIGAVLGREFRYDLLLRVSEEDEASLKKALGRLVEAELIYQRGFYPDVSFIFKHALIQDAAYETLLRKRRRALHEKVARLLEESETQAQPELVAYHYTAAEIAEKAIPHWIQAGHRAMTRYENQEAVRHLTAGRELVASLPQGRERDAVELSLLVPLGHALNMANGYWAPEGEAVLSRASELCDSIDDVQPLILALMGLSSTHIVRGNYAKASDIARRIRDVRGGASDRVQVISAYLMAAIDLFRGALPHAIAHADEVERTYDPTKHAVLRQMGSGTLSKSARLYSSFAKLLMGYPDQARSGLLDLLDEAIAGDYHFDLYQAYLYCGLLELSARDYEAVHRHTATYLDIGREYGDPFPMLITNVIHHLAIRGEGESAAFRSSKGLMEAMRAAGYGLGYSVLLGEYARGLLAYDDPAGAQDALDEAFAHIEKAGGEVWEPEIHRLQGDVLLARKHAAEEVQTWYERAIDLARCKEAKLFELRASNSVARLWKDQERTEEAHTLLSGVYGWFTEGFAEADLAEARDIMESLPVA